MSSYIIKGSSIIFLKPELPQGWTQEQVDKILTKAKQLKRNEHRYINVHTCRAVKYGIPSVWYNDEFMICGKGEVFDKLIEWIMDNYNPDE